MKERMKTTRVRFVHFWYSFRWHLPGCITQHIGTLLNQIKTKQIFLKRQKETVNASSTLYRNCTKFYIFHSCITRESCTLESERFTAAMKYHLSLIQVDVFACCFRDAFNLSFYCSFHTKNTGVRYSSFCIHWILEILKSLRWVIIFVFLCDKHLHFQSHGCWADLTLYREFWGVLFHFHQD